MLAMPSGVLFQAVRRPSIGFRLSVVRLVVVATTLIPLTHFFGLVGAVYSVLLSVVIIFPVSLYYAAAITGVSVTRHGRIALEYLVPSGVFVLGLGSKDSLMTIFIEIGTLVLFYVCGVFALSSHGRNLLLSYFREKGD